MLNDTIQMIKERSTTHFYQPDKELSVSKINELVDAATSAPTAFNLQNWKFIAVQSSHAKMKLRKFAWNQDKVTDASVIFIVCGVLPDYQAVDERLTPSVKAGILPDDIISSWTDAAKNLYFDFPQRSRDEAVRSATFGASTLILAATSMGLGSTPMIGFDADKIKTELELAEDDIPVMLLAVGYAKAENWSQKIRRPLNDILEII
ncbi:nitroreductase family protein [Alteromonas sp. 5E99-2]|uniref:nitroreductase family protein n=1 Tax=Alteromonas sp. 5E99-2 TaxID=2817683 RepID=UPI001A997DB5|nr:nitroreductase family protein [Alteromonas sp. 5E99-2]MBO1255461.1 nitroreductase family protein [Alteromonas sp. 5E99-2]